MKKYFMHPVERIAITCRYISGAHGGIDYGWEKGHQTDTKILASNDGTVVTCEFGTYVGNYIVIKHGERDGKMIYTRYGHLRSFSVKPGDTVKIGQEIGIMGETGEECYGVHLHFDYVPCTKTEGFNLNRRINPAPYLYVYNNQRYIEDQDDVVLRFANMSTSEAEEETTEKTANTTYVVKAGDVMWRIAQAHNVSLSALIDANPQIENPNIIHVGDIINIPVKETPKMTTYTVKKGDTMWEIADKHYISLAKLEEANPQVENSNLIYAGQKLNIPM